MENDNGFEDGGHLYCGSCGAIFGLDDVSDFDDVKCPDCGSGDVGGSDDLDAS